jgi:hypothetical protein
MCTSLRFVCLMALSGFLLSGVTAWAQLADKKVITLAGVDALPKILEQ